MALGSEKRRIQTLKSGFTPTAQRRILGQLIETLDCSSNVYSTGVNRSAVAMTVLKTRVSKRADAEGAGFRVSSFDGWFVSIHDVVFSVRQIEDSEL